MGIYRRINYKIEDLFIKMLTKKQDSKIIKQKVDQFRAEQEEIRKMKRSS